jgi:hypothetical protein
MRKFFVLRMQVPHTALIGKRADVNDRAVDTPRIMRG